jgi:hypothetical protein
VTFDAPAVQPQPTWTQPTSRHDRIQQRRAARRDRRATRW